MLDFGLGVKYACFEICFYFIEESLVSGCLAFRFDTTGIASSECQLLELIFRGLRIILTRCQD